MEILLGILIVLVAAAAFNYKQIWRWWKGGPIEQTGPPTLSQRADLTEATGKLNLSA